MAERLYLEGDAVLSFEAEVTDIREFARQDGVQVWHIALDRTAFYPTGGGQPHDRGVLRARSRSGTELDVLVSEVVEDESGEVWHATTKPLLTGTTVTGLVDADRRLDHQQQHSGQHLLSAILADRFGAPTIGFHLGDADATIDLEVEDKAARAALIEQLPTVEAEVNRAIASDLPVHVRIVPQQEAQELLAEGRLRKLPPREGPIRLIEIPGLDLNACGGTHVRSLGVIGSVLLRSTERVRKSLRLHFVCGLRAVRAAQTDFSVLSAAATALSSSPDHLLGTIYRLQSDVKTFAKERRNLRERLAALHAVQLAVEERPDHGLRVVYRRFADCDIEFLRLVADSLLSAVPRTVALFESTLQEPATILLACNIDNGQSCIATLQQAIRPWNLRGGGTASLAQAEVPLQHLEVVTEDLLRQISMLA